MIPLPNDFKEFLPFFHLKGVAWDGCYARRQSAVLDNVTVSVIALEYLKRNKAATGRLKDRNHLQNLP